MANKPRNSSLTHKLPASTTIASDMNPAELAHKTPNAAANRGNTGNGKLVHKQTAGTKTVGKTKSTKGGTSFKRVID